MPGAGSDVLGLRGRGFFVQSASFHHLVRSTSYRGLYDNLFIGRLFFKEPKYVKPHFGHLSCMNCSYWKFLFLVGIEGSPTFDKENTTEEVCVSRPWEGYRDRGELN